jgi:hypothetical protein
VYLVCLAAVRFLPGAPARTCGTYSSAGGGAGGRACLRAVPPAGFLALAAGVTWTSRTTSAPWAARCWHTSVVDAAGAIYVVGGSKGHSAYNDVWATDGGADRTKSRGSRGKITG